MEITDKRLQKILKKYPNSFLEEALQELSEDEIEEDSEKEVVLNEIDWLLYKYSEPGNYEYEVYTDCKSFIKKLHSKKGVSVKDVREVTTKSIEAKKKIIEEYDNLWKIDKELIKL